MDDTLPEDAPTRADGELPVVDPSCYELGEELARGGFGRLLRARDKRLDREVAIKQLHANSAQLEARFRLEARITARLSHPAIVPVHEVGRWPSGEPFYAMKLVTGRSLRAVLDATPALADRLALVPALAQIADAVGYAHGEGVLHRDLKPGNIMLDERGAAFVVDWGLAKDRRADPPAPEQRAGDAALTSSGAVLGTPPYLSPEQARGDVVEERADVYSLGAIGYELIAGTTPYAGSSGEVLAEIASTPPPPLAARQPSAPRELVAIVERAMARDAADRYPTARELADDLRRFANGELVSAYRYSRVQRARRWLARHRGAAVASTAVVVALAAGGVAWRARGAHAWRPIVRPLAAVEEQSSTVALSPDGRLMAFDSDRDGTLAIWVGPVDGPPHRVSPARFRFASHVRFRGNDRILYTTPDGVFDQPVTGGEPERVLPAFADHANACGDRIVAWRTRADAPLGETEIVIADATGVHPRLAIDPRYDVYMLRCDPAGRRIVYTLADTQLRSPNAQIWVLDLDGGEPRHIIDGERRGATFSADGTSIVFSSARSGAINLWEVPIRGGEPEQLTFGAGPDDAPEVAADGKSLVFDVDNTAVPIVEIGVGREPRRLTAAIDKVRWITTSHGGAWLAYHVERGAATEVVVRELASGTERVLGTGIAPAFSPDDRTVYWASEDRVVRADRDGSGLRDVARLPGAIYALAMGRDGTLHAEVSPASGPQEAWSIAADGTTRREAPAPYTLIAPAPSGDWTAAVRVDGIELVAPGAHAGDATNRHVRMFGAWDVDGTSFVYLDRGELHRYTLATGADEVILATGISVQWVAPAADRRTFYIAKVISHVTRNVIANFADRR